MKSTRAVWVLGIHMALVTAADARGAQLVTPDMPSNQPAQSVWLENAQRQSDGWYYRTFKIIGATDRQPRNEYYDLLTPDEASRVTDVHGYYYCHHRDWKQETGGQFSFGQ